MEPTLDEALNDLFGKQQPEAVATPATQTNDAAPQDDHRPVGRRPGETQFDNAQQAMQQGDWDKFGKAMAALKQLLANPAM